MAHWGKNAFTIALILARMRTLPFASHPTYRRTHGLEPPVARQRHLAVGSLRHYRCAVLPGGMGRSPLYGMGPTILADLGRIFVRSAERRVGKKWCSTCISRWSPSQ